MMERDALKELAKCVALHIPEESFILCCLCSLKTDEERENMIKYLNTNKNLSKTDIDIKILQITRKRYAKTHGI